MSPLPRPVSKLADDICFSHSPGFRRRAGMLFAIVALYAVIKLVPLPGVSCEISAAKTCADGDSGTISFVPADAYAYAHVDLDSGQANDARAIAARLPHFDSVVQGLLESVAPGNGFNLGSDIGSWAGDEIAFAEVPSKGGMPEPLLIASVADSAGAEDFLIKAAGQPTGQAKYDGGEVARYAGGMASAERDGFLVYGSEAGVRSGLHTHGDSADSLASDDIADEVRSALPDDRFADAYVSQDAYTLLRRTRLGGALDTFTDFGASKGLAIAGVATPEGFTFELASDLDPDRVEAAPGFLSAFPPFDPSLAGLFDPDTLALLQIGDPSKTVAGLLDQAEALQPGISAAYERLRAQLRKGEGFDIADDLVAQLGDQMALGIAPGKGGPYLTAAFDGVDEGQARAAVARLAGPLIGSVDPAQTGQAPSFSQSEIDGVRVVSLRLSPATAVSLAAFDGHLIVTTDPEGVKRAVDGKDGLTGTAGYRAVGDVGSGDPSAIVFLDLAGLVDFGKPLGLTGIRNYVRFKQDFARLGALGVRASTDEDSIDTQISLQIDQGDQDK